MRKVIYQPHYSNSWALIIGIDAYQHASPLKYACNDANVVVSVLIKELDFPSDQIIILKNTKATKQAILNTFLDFSEKCDPDDRVLVFFAGHGTTVTGIRGEIGFLIPFDGNPNKVSTLIRWDDFTHNAELIPAKHILFIMDACYSGLVMKRSVKLGSKRFLNNMLQRLVRQVITAGKGDEEVADGGGPKGANSIFTGYLLDGLLGDASDENGVLTASGLMYYVYQKVSQDPRSKQTPHYGYLEGDGDFIFRTVNDIHLSEHENIDYVIPDFPVMEEELPYDKNTIQYVKNKLKNCDENAKKILKFFVLEPAREVPAHLLRDSLRQAGLDTEADPKIIIGKLIKLGFVRENIQRSVGQASTTVYVFVEEYREILRKLL